MLLIVFDMDDKRLVNTLSLFRTWDTTQHYSSPCWWLATVKFLCIPESDAGNGLGGRGSCVHWSRPPSWSQNTCYYASTQTLTHCGHREQRVRQHTVVVVRRESSDTGSMAETSTLATLATRDLGTGEGPRSSLHWTDYLVIVGYFLSVIVVSRLLYGETS